MKRLFALGLAMAVVSMLGCGEDKRPTLVFIPDGLMIESPDGTRYTYVIINQENDPVEERIQGIGVQGETFIELGFFLVAVIRDPETTEGNVTVTWTQGTAEIEDIKPGDDCVHVYVTEEYPTIFRNCMSKGFSQTLN